MGQGSIQPGDLLPVAKDVLREQTLLFRAGDAVTVLALWQDPSTHGLYYLAQSPLTGEYWYLCEADLRASSPSAPPSSPPPPAHYQHVGQHTAPASHPQAPESPAPDGIWGRLATYVLIVTVVILSILGGAMLLFFIWPANDALAGIGELFFPFGVFLILLPAFLLGMPIAQRAVAAHEYDREREQILTQHAGAFEAAYGPMVSPVPAVTLPTGRERCLCWRCGADNAEGASTCANCGTHFNNWIGRLIPVNTYTSTLFIWASIPIFILFPFFLGNTFSDEFQRFYLFFYLLCFLMYVLVLAPLVMVARFNFTQAVIAYALSPVMPLSMIYVYQNAQKNMGRERSMDLNHFRRGDGRVNTWGAMKEKQLRGIIIAFYCDTGKLFKAKPAKRLRFLKWGAQMDPYNHRVLYHLAREQFASGNRMLGFYELDNALRLFPGHEQYVEMRVAMKSGASPTPPREG